MKEEEEEKEELIRKLEMLQGMGGGAAGGSVAGGIDFEEIQKMVNKMRERIEDQTPYSMYLKNQGKMPAMFQGMNEEEFRDVMEFQRMKQEMAKDQVKDVGWMQGEKDTMYLPSGAKVVDGEIELTGWQKIGDTETQLQETRGFGAPDETPARVILEKSPEVSVKDKKRVLNLIDRAENLLLQNKYESAARLLVKALRKSEDPTIEKVLIQAHKELAYKEYEKWAEKADMLAEKGKHERAIRLIMNKLEKVEDERLEEHLRGEINRLELLKIQAHTEMADDHVYFEKYRSHEDNEIDKVRVLQKGIKNTSDPEVKQVLMKNIADIRKGKLFGKDATMVDYWNAHPEKHREYVEMLELAIKNSRNPQRKAELRKYLNELKSQE
jgi:tetratricopeptide (TPR) repeat protein